MLEFISFDEVLRKLGIRPFEIFPHLQNGLQPYSKESGNRIHCPPLHHAKTINEHQYHSLSNTWSDLGCLEKIEKDLLVRTNETVCCEEYYNAIRHLKDAERVVGRDLPFYPGMELATGLTVKPGYIGPRHLKISHPRDAKDLIYVYEFQINTLKKYEQRCYKTIKELIGERQEIEKNDPLCQSWKYFIKPNSDEAIKKIISELKNTIFKIDEVNNLEATGNVKGDEILADVEIEKAESQNSDKEVTPLPKGVVELIEEVRESGEIEKIYQAIKENEGFSELSVDANKRRKKNALDYLEEYRNGFEHLDEKVLAADNIYATSESQYPRTVKGRMLQSLIRKKGLRAFSYERLFIEYQKK